jgi:hypothetical protein
MAGNLSDDLVDGFDHSCWPIWRGKHRQPPAEIQGCGYESRDPLQFVHGIRRLCGRPFDAVAASNAFAVKWFHWQNAPQAECLTIARHRDSQKRNQHLSKELEDDAQNSASVRLTQWAEHID